MKAFVVVEIYHNVFGTQVVRICYAELPHIDNKLGHQVDQYFNIHSTFKTHV